MSGRSLEVVSEVETARPTTTTSQSRPAPRYTCRCGEPHDLEALRAAGAEIGERVSIDPSVTIDYPEGLSIGNDVEIGPGVRFFAEAGVKLGDRVIIGPGAQILSSEPKIPSGNRRIHGAGRRNVPILVHDDVYIGPAAIINPGVTVENSVYVLPGSVVYGYISHTKLVRGNPASTYRSRNNM